MSFVHDNPFQPSLIFAGRARANPIVLHSGILALLANIRIGLKDFQVINTIAYLA
jgi:hypothetical protein